MFSKISYHPVIVKRQIYHHLTHNDETILMSCISSFYDYWMARYLMKCLIYSNIYKLKFWIVNIWLAIWLTSWLISWLNQSVNQSVSRSVNWSVRSVGQSVDQIGRSVGRSTGRSQTFDRPISVTVMTGYDHDHCHPYLQSSICLKYYFVHGSTWWKET